ncbi:hypothetical protein Dsin_005530 [Dipteronia sinensis]|uniref:RRM domain-containing protein n=1 Tax=Dipteronia sinensis TaxID=43782 RepID=A0AAE0EEP7_9ROSI|nr:hypothetical protein Dsin_005530 [Dipteronia sinensis]
MRERGRERSLRHRSTNSNRDIREGLISIFVDNLNHGVDQAKLWGIFKQFGMVRDMFLSSKNSMRRSAFAFIRFASMAEATKVARLTDGMHIYGWPITSKIVVSGWNNRRTGPINYGGKESRGKMKASRNEFKRESGTDQGGDRRDKKRSYVEVVMGNDRKKDTREKERMVKKDKMFWDGSKTEARWLEKCAVRVRRSFNDVSTVNDRLTNEGLYFSSSYLGNKLIEDPIMIDENCLSRRNLVWDRVLVLIPDSKKSPDKIKVVSSRFSTTIVVEEKQNPVVVSWVEEIIGLKKGKKKGGKGKVVIPVKKYRSFKFKMLKTREWVERQGRKIGECSYQRNGALETNIVVDLGPVREVNGPTSTYFHLESDPSSENIQKSGGRGTDRGDPITKACHCNQEDTMTEEVELCDIDESSLISEDEKNVPSPTPQPQLKRKGRKRCYSVQKHGMRSRILKPKEVQNQKEKLSESLYKENKREDKFDEVQNDSQDKDGMVVIDTEGNRLVWNLEEEIAKVIETGVALGFKFGGN